MYCTNQSMEASSGVDILHDDERSNIGEFAVRTEGVRRDPKSILRVLREEDGCGDPTDDHNDTRQR